jgi:peptidoglycan-associated lipoprotein
MMLRRALVLGTLAVAASLSAGCKKKPQVTPTPGSGVTTTTTTTSNADSIAAARAREEAARRAAFVRDSIEAARRDSINRANAAPSPGETARLRELLVAAVYFDYDRADLRDDAKTTLEAKVPILMRNTDVTLRLAGHTDNRGSDEYNLALAMRRAAAAKQYLIDRGVPAARLETISYGEERPACTQEEESCWAQNRRAEFEIRSGGTTLRR